MRSAALCERSSAVGIQSAAMRWVAGAEDPNQRLPGWTSSERDGRERCFFDGPGTDECVLLVHNSSTGEGAR
jgi:hypothetical protein